MFPENSNPNQNPNPGVPQQPTQTGSAPFQRRPVVQPIASRPFVPPQPSQQSQGFNSPQPVQQRPAPQFTAQPQPQFTPPQPVQRPAPQLRPIPPQQPTSLPPSPKFSQPQQNMQSPAFPQSTPFETSVDQPIGAGFTRPARPQAVESRSGIPKGVFALVGISLVGLILGLMDKSQHNMIFNVTLGLDLLLALGLFARKDFLRKASMGFALATVTASAALALSYWGLSSSTVSAETTFVAEAKKLQNQSPTKQLTHEQQQHLDGMQLQLEAQQKAIGQNSTLVYSKYGTTVVLFALAALYLSRPKVKLAFEQAS